MSQRQLNQINFLTETVANLTDRIAALEHEVETLKGKVNPIKMDVPKRGRPKKTD